jgi:hypothetical protein
MRSPWLCCLVAGVLGCAPAPLSAPSPPPVVVAIPSAPVDVTAQAAPSPPPADQADSGATDERVLSRANAILAGPVDFSSMIRLEINSQFPGAVAVKDALVGAGAPWKEDDWFADTLPPAHWEVHVGADVGAAAVQAVIAACVLQAGRRFTVVLLTENEELQHRQRVYVGGLDIQKAHPPSLERLDEMLSPGLDKSRLHLLVGRVE